MIFQHLRLVKGTCDVSINTVIPNFEIGITRIEIYFHHFFFEIDYQLVEESTK